jgi:hypothetical protein
MWSKEDAENWFFKQLELIETIVVEYFRLFFGILFRPKTTLRNTHDKEIVTPFIFFVINLISVGIVDAANIFDFLKVILKSLVLTTKPTFDEAFYSILGLLIGTLLFIYIFRFVSGRIAKTKLQFKIIVKPILYASFLFIPISVIKEVINMFVLGRFLSLINAFIGGSYLFIIFIASTAGVYLVMLCWWLYVVYLALQVNLGEKSNFKSSYGIALTLICYFVISIPIANLDNMHKIATIYQLNKYKNEVDVALAKQPPDYFSAAGATMFLSGGEEATPYRRYCEKIRAITYFSKLVNGFDANEQLVKINNGQYEDVEEYYIKMIEKVAATNHSLEEYKYLNTIKNLIDNAKKDKEDKKYVRGEYISSLSFFELQFLGKSHSIRIIP